MNTPPFHPLDPDFLPDDAGVELFDLGLHGDEIVMGASEQAGARIGRFRLISPLGEGGFGFVWRAEQTEPIHRELALKVIKLGMDSREIIARFAAESQALAMMDHPNIAAVLDAGTTADGRPYFAMELVKGQPLTNYCDSRNLSLRERLELFIPVCQAVQHAHQKAILHRDLKPSNILVTVVDGKAVPKVIDFGIAKALGKTGDFALQASMLQTHVGAIIGTPQYMSPEQAGSVPDVDTRSDIYSLGVILYELLTGQTPLCRSGGEQVTAYDETLRRIRIEEAPKPSTAFYPPTPSTAEAAALRDSEPAKLRRFLKGDLDRVVLKSLAKDRRRRYETATALAADLRRFLKEEPVSAVAPTWHYQFGKMVKRNRTVFVAATVVFLTLITATIIGFAQAKEARTARERAERSRIEADKNLAAAEANEAKARRTVETYLTKVTDHDKLKEEGFRTLRTELLETALPFYEELAAKESKDPSLQSDRAWVLGKLGALYRSLDQREKSILSLNAAMKIEEAVAAAFPDDAIHQKALVVGGNNISVVLGEMEKYDEAVAVQQHSITIIEGLIRKHPDSQEYPMDLSILLVGLGQNLARAGKIPESETAMLRAIEVRQKLANNAPESDSYLDEVASALADFGRILAEKGRFLEAEPRFRRAMEIQEKLVGKHPEDIKVVRDLAGTCYNFAFYLYANGKNQEALELQKKSNEINLKLTVQLPVDSSVRYALAMGYLSAGHSLVALDRKPEGEKFFRDAVEMLRALSSEFPLNGTYAYLAGTAFESMGKLRHEAKDMASAKELLGDSFEMQRKALTSNLTNKMYQTAVAEAINDLAEFCLETGDAAGAMNAALEIPRYFPKDWEQQERAAGFMAGAIPLIKNNTTMKPRDRRQAAEQAASSALDLLQCSIDLGNTHLPEIFSEPRLVNLRGNARFDEMERTLAPAVDDRSPSSFRFNYAFDDPGPRVWTREEKTWTEKPPTGREKKFTIVRRVRVLGRPGTELGEVGNTGLTIFIPDKGTPEPAKILMKQGNGNWGSLGTIEAME